MLLVTCCKCGSNVTFTTLHLHLYTTYTLRGDNVVCKLGNCLRKRQVTCYTPRWFTRPQAVTHPSTNWAKCRLTSLIKLTPRTSKPTLRRPINSVFLRLWWRNCVLAEWKSGAPAHLYRVTVGKWQTLALWRRLPAEIRIVLTGEHLAHNDLW